MRAVIKTSILTLPLLATLGGGMSALAQDFQAANPNDMVLVTPEGDLLDYIPDASDVTVRKNRQGFRVLIDHYGNLVATEMPARRYARSRNGQPERLPGITVYGNGNTNNQDDTYANNQDDSDPNYFPARPRSDNQSGDVTGSVPEVDDQNAQGAFQDQQLPSDGIQSDNMNGDQSDQDMASLDPNDPNQPALEEQRPDPDPVITLNGKKSRFEITALQVFLDREGASPGVIDGKMGLNVSKAIIAYEKITGERLDPNNSEDILTRLGLNGGLPVMNYTITSADAAGPYVAQIPEDYSVKATLPAMSYTSVTEALGERFHMDEDYLKELNPGVDFTMPGSVIKVINPGAVRKGNVARIIADKARKQVFAYDDSGALIAAYPASIGSNDTPSPSGIHLVDRVALDPNYTYNPKINFQQGQNTKILTIPPGPNGPVGTVWIALDKPTYGIHGTPDPSRIGKTQSHGCIRLTNWDATELAKMVKPGVTVEFID
jgi:lipoprotein-anchoring transpeptidase ErfK/SrfK